MKTEYLTNISTINTKAELKEFTEWLIENYIHLLKIEVENDKTLDNIVATYWKDKD